MSLMTKVFFVTTLLFFLFLGVYVYAAAGTPSIFSYQGRLANSSGDLLGSSSGTTYYFKFSIWDNATVDSGTRLWPSSIPATTTATVRSGVFNVNIEVSDYNFNTNKDIYLQVEVSSDNISSETLSPRQRISSAVFAQIAGAVSGTGQSSFGTTTPFSGAVVTMEATSTIAIPLVIRGFLNQVEDLFRIVTNTGTSLSTFTASGNLGIGTTTPARKLNVLEAGSNPQLRLGQTSSLYGEFYADGTGDIQISSIGGNIRQNDENVWVCSSGCDTATPGDTGNLIIDRFLIFDNGFKFKQDNSSTTMYDIQGNAILQFDDGQ